MNTKYIISLTALVALTGALSYGAAGDLTPIGSLACLYETVAGEVSDFADVTPDILASLDRKDLLQLATIGRKEPERFPNLYQDARAELFRQKIRQFLQQHNGDVRKALFDAAGNDKAWAIDYLVQNGADLNARDKYDWTALMWAAHEGHGAMVAQLIAAGADLNVRNKDRITALMKAAYKGHAPVVAQLIAAGANVNEKNNHDWTALMWAAYHGHEAVVAQLLAAGANFDEKNNNGETALISAAYHGHEAVVAQLIAAGANVDEKNNSGESALSITKSAATNEFHQALRDRARAIVVLLTRGG